MNSADMSGLEKKRWNWEKSRNCQVQLQKRSGLVKIIVTIQYLHSYDYSYKTVLIAGVACVELTAL